MKGVGFGGSTQEESSTRASRFWMLSSLTPIRGILKMVQIVAKKHVYLPGKSNEANRKKTLFDERPHFLISYSLFSRP